MIKLLSVLLIALALTACGQRVTVGPNEVGKKLTSSGYENQIIPTSVFRLQFCGYPGAICDKLVTLSAADFEVREELKLFMPKDKLETDFDIQLILSVNPDHYNQLFTKIPAREYDDGYYIPISSAYNIYAQQVIKTIAREIMAEYTIADIASNREAVGNILSQRLSEEIFKQTPFIARSVNLADVSYPEVITRAQIQAAERREQIAEEEAKTQKRMIELEREYIEAEKQRKVDVEKALAEAEVNKILGDSITESYLLYKQLEVLNKMAESENKVFVPVSMLDSVASQVMLGK